MENDNDHDKNKWYMIMKNDISILWLLVW